MKATFGLEYFGKGLDDEIRFHKEKYNFLMNGIGDKLIGKSHSRRPWVAEIIGIDERYGYARKFLNGKVSYKYANSKATRGVMLWFILESGKLYEVKHYTSWKNSVRYFCEVSRAGDIRTMELNEVNEWLNNH